MQVHRLSEVENPRKTYYLFFRETDQAGRINDREEVIDTRKQWESNNAKISVSAGNRTQIVRFAL